MTLMSDTAPPLASWVVYDHPKFRPTKFVAWLWRGEHPTKHLLVDSTLDGLRAQIQERFDGVPFERSPEDDPTIVEVWL